MRLSVATACLLIWSSFPAIAQQSGAVLGPDLARSATTRATSKAGYRAGARCSRCRLSMFSEQSHRAAWQTWPKSGPMTSARQSPPSVTGPVSKGPPPAAASQASGNCAERLLAFAGAFDRPGGTGGAWISTTAAFSGRRWRADSGAGAGIALKWAFGFPGASVSYAPPAVVGGVLFIGGTDRKVHALDAKSGCTIWTSRRMRRSGPR